jgi:hypothetical protein
MSLERTDLEPRFYPSEPGVDILRDGETFRLREELIFVSEDQEMVRVPAGFVTDLASIPQILHSAFPKLGKHTLPAIIHDYMYVEAIETKAKADLFFRQAMKFKKVNTFKRQAMYWGVRLGGRGNYED